MRLSLHQPNFMPWYPFFQKMVESDIFIILINCQYTRRNYQNRFNIDKEWYSMGVKKVARETLIKDMEYISPISDWNKIKNKLPQHEILLNEFDSCIDSSLMNTNFEIIKRVMGVLNIKTSIHFDFETPNSSTDRTIEICKKYGADVYYSGISGANYLDIEKFNYNNIKLEFQNEEKMIKKPILKYLSEL